MSFPGAEFLKRFTKADVAVGLAGLAFAGVFDWFARVAAESKAYTTMDLADLGFVGGLAVAAYTVYDVYNHSQEPEADVHPVNAEPPVDMEKFTHPELGDIPMYPYGGPLASEENLR